MGRPNINVYVGANTNENQSRYVTKYLKASIPFAIQVCDPDTKYVVRYDYDLGGETVEMPTGCMLAFEGGSVSNGKLIGNNTYVDGKFEAEDGLYYYGFVNMYTGNVIHNTLYSDIMKVGYIRPYNGSIYDTDEDIYTSFLYSIKGKEYITNKYENSDRYSVQYYFYDKKGYYVGAGYFSNRSPIYIPAEAKDGYARMCIYTNGEVSVEELMFTSNILSDDYIYPEEILENKADTYVSNLPLDISKLERYSGYVYNNYYATAEGYSCFVIPVNRGGVRYDTLYIKAGSLQYAQFAFVRSYNINYPGYIQFCSSRPYTIQHYKNSYGNYDIPSDCTYIIINAEHRNHPDVEWNTPVELTLKNLRSPINKKFYDDDKRLYATRFENYNASGHIIKAKFLHWNVGHFAPDGLPVPYYETRTELAGCLNGIRTFINTINPDFVSMNEYQEVTEAKDGQKINVRDSVLSTFRHYYIGLDRTFIQNAFFSRLKYDPSDNSERLVSNPDQGTGIVYNRAFNNYTLVQLLTINNTVITLCIIHACRTVSGGISVNQVKTLFEQYGALTSCIIVGDFNSTNPNEEEGLKLFTDAGWNLVGAPETYHNISISSSNQVTIDGVTYYYTEVSLRKYDHLYLKDSNLYVINSTNDGLFLYRDLYYNNLDSDTSPQRFIKSDDSFITIKIASRTTGTYNDGYSVIVPTFWKNRSVRYDWLLYKNVKVSNFQVHTDIERSDHFPISFDIETIALPSNPRYGYNTMNPTTNKPIWWDGEKWIDADGNAIS